jgi:hypothetical protein
MTFAKTLTLCCCLGVFHVLQGQTLIFEGLKRNNLWAPQNMRVFVGLGGRFIYKKVYETDLRIDYGTSLYGSGRGLVVGLGQYF